MFLSDICLGNKFQNAVHKVNIYINKHYQNYQYWKHYRR